MYATICPTCKEPMWYMPIGGGVSQAACSRCRKGRQRRRTTVIGWSALCYLLITAILVLACSAPEWQTAPQPMVENPWTTIGINGHLDKVTGRWTPGFGFVTADGDTICCWWTPAAAQAVADNMRVESAVK